ncbi:MAG: hypothetical protein FD129_529 [bacterium]|nr:MAG: hypothetical protein FD129_529 [bacterium]
MIDRVGEAGPGEVVEEDPRSLGHPVAQAHAADRIVAAGHGAVGVRAMERGAGVIAEGDAGVVRTAAIGDDLSMRRVVAERGHRNGRIAELVMRHRDARIGVVDDLAGTVDPLVPDPPVAVHVRLHHPLGVVVFHRGGDPWLDPVDAREAGRLEDARGRHPDAQEAIDAVVGFQVDPGPERLQSITVATGRRVGKQEHGHRNRPGGHGRIGRCERAERGGHPVGRVPLAGPGDAGKK